MSSDERRTRRDVLRAAGVVAGAAVAGQLVGAETAGAADGDNFKVGQANAASSKTTLATSGTIASDGALSVTAPNADYGVAGNAAQYGVYGTGPGGVLGVGTVGGVFVGSTVAINLAPQDDPGAPLAQSYKGDLAVDANGVLWLCVAAGATPGPTPATWIRVSHGGIRLLPTPQRAYSSTDVGPGTRINQGETRTIPLAGVVPGVPGNALGIVLNLTVHQTLSGGNLTAFPAGSTPPNTSSVNWFATGQQLANAATIGVGTGGALSFRADAAVPPGSPATHFIVDVTGYVL